MSERHQMVYDACTLFLLGLRAHEAGDVTHDSALAAHVPHRSVSARRNNDLTANVLVGTVNQWP
jgi:hypothetical protein